MATDNTESTKVTIKRPGDTEQKTLIDGEQFEVSSSGPVTVEVTAGVSEFWVNRETDPAELRDLLVRQGKSKADLADRFDITKSSVRRWLDRAGIDAESDS